MRILIPSFTRKMPVRGMQEAVVILAAPTRCRTLRRVTTAACILVAVLAGCSDSRDGPGRGLTPVAQDEKSATRQLAYEHSVSFDGPPEQLPVIHAAGVAACRTAGPSACVMLESRIDSGPDAQAMLKFRATPQVIPLLVTAMGSKADLVRQSTSAEDLSGPIADTARQLAMLEDYRSRLEGMRSRAGHDIDSLIKLNRELADVQASLEAVDGKRALLALRVETEILNVSIGTKAHQKFRTPIGRALGSFGGHLAEGIAYAISALAYLLPWLFLIALPGWSGYRLWRFARNKRK